MGRGREQIEYLLQALKHSDVSGFELLEFLDIRSRLAIQEPLFSQDDRRRLEDIDRQLLKWPRPGWHVSGRLLTWQRCGSALGLYHLIGGGTWTRLILVCNQQIQ